MSELNKLRIGEVTNQFPAKTFNALVDGELRDRNKSGSIDDTRQPKQKLPVIARLVWSGADAVDPGRALKLGAAVFEPATDEWAPFAGLAFFVTAFAGGDLDQPYAIAMGPISPGNTTPAVGYGVLPECWWAKVNITNAAHTHAMPATGTLLASGTSGQRMLWKESGTGEKWAVLFLAEGEKYRLIRGQSYGVQSGATILIDNVVVLAGGIDPSAGNPATQITVKNIFSQSYADNEYIDAVYSPGVSTSPAADWETLKTGTGTDTYRLLRAKVKGAVTAAATSFTVDNIIPEAGSLDPRSTPGDMAEELTVYKLQKEILPDNTDVTIIYSPAVDTGIDWELLVVERFRAGYGDWYSGTSTLLVKNLVMLDFSKDPRTDPTDVNETISVINIADDTYSSGDKVWFDYDAKNARWVARQKTGSTSNSQIRFARVYSTISAAAGQLAADWGSGLVKYQDDATGVLDTSPTSVVNLLIGIDFVIDAQVEVDTGREPARVLTGTCGPVTWSESVGSSTIVSTAITASTQRRYHALPNR